MFQDSLIIPFGSLEKQGRPSHVRGHLQLLKNEGDPRLCPVLAILT